jgi:hypothetical protein
MTFTIGSEHVYVAIILILMAIQVWQWRVIFKFQKECDHLWTQLGTLAASLAAQIISMQQEISKKEDKKIG